MGKDNRLDEMSSFNDQFDDIRSALYRLLDFAPDDFSEKKGLAKREVLYAINELRIKVDNL
jgi:hypothetical protein